MRTKNYVIGDQGNELFKACYRFIFTDEGNNYEILDEIWKLIFIWPYSAYWLSIFINNLKKYRYLALEICIGNCISTHFNYPYIYQFIYHNILDKVIRSSDLWNNKVCCIQVMKNDVNPLNLKINNENWSGIKWCATKVTKIVCGLYVVAYFHFRYPYTSTFIAKKDTN